MYTSKTKLPLWQISLLNIVDCMKYFEILHVLRRFHIKYKVSVTI